MRLKRRQISRPSLSLNIYAVGRCMRESLKAMEETRRNYPRVSERAGSGGPSRQLSSSFSSHSTSFKEDFCQLRTPVVDTIAAAAVASEVSSILLPFNCIRQQPLCSGRTLSVPISLRLVTNRPIQRIKSYCSRYLVNLHLYPLIWKRFHPYMYLSIMFD